MIISEHRTWLLHKKPSGDSSAFLTFFSEIGLIKAYFKGGLKPKTRGLLQPFIPLWASFSTTSRPFVQKLEQMDTPLLLPGSLLFLGFYLNELIYTSLQPGEAFPLLYQCYEKSLTLLPLAKTNNELEIILRRFEWALLESTGYGLSLQHVAGTHEAIHPRCFYHFIPGLGLIEKVDGLLGQDLLDFAHGDFSKPSVLKTAKLVMRKAIDHLMEGKTLKSRALFTVSKT